MLMLDTKLGCLEYDNPLPLSDLCHITDPVLKYPQLEFLFQCIYILVTQSSTKYLENHYGLLSLKRREYVNNLIVSQRS